MRHGESEEDVDKAVYAHTADLDIALSPHGEVQAVEAGHALKSKLGGQKAHFYLSPGLRLRQTYDLMAKQAADGQFTQTTEPQILKQFWGDVTVENRREIEIERYKEGVLVYRFPNGESGGELIERFQIFVRSLHQDFQRQDFPENIVVMTHGFEMRLFLTVWFDWTIADFEKLANPRNCEMITLTQRTDGSYRLEEKLRAYDPSSNPNHITRT